MIAAYAVAQRVFGLAAWDQAWLDAVGLRQHRRRDPDDAVRVFGTLNGPGTLAPLLALSLLCYLTLERARPITRGGRDAHARRPRADLRALGLGGADRRRHRARGRVPGRAAPGSCSAPPR